MVAKFTLVLAYRDRDTERVQRCLDSLKNQELLNFELIFVDYGSKTQAIRELVETYSFCQYVYSDTRGLPWNRAKSLNIGIKKSQSEFTITSDIDMIFPPDFFAKVSQLAQEDRVVNARCYWIPEKFDDWANIFSYNSFPSSNDAGKGGFQLVSTKNLHAIHGFDEYYQYYGIEDRDLDLRLGLIGLKQIWFEEKKMYHQWHETVSYQTADFIPEGLWERMNLHYWESRDTALRNTEDWGKITTTEMRSVYRYLEPETYKLKTSEQLHNWSKSTWSHQVNSEFLLRFANLPSGDAMLIENYYTAAPKAMTRLTLRLANRIVRIFNPTLQLDYRINRLRMLLAFLVQQNQLASDYYIAPDKSYAIFVRA